jgi:hypothetical protein
VHIVVKRVPNPLCILLYIFSLTLSLPSFPSLTLRLIWKISSSCFIVSLLMGIRSLTIEFRSFVDLYVRLRVILVAKNILGILCVNLLV